MELIKKIKQAETNAQEIIEQARSEAANRAESERRNRAEAIEKAEQKRKKATKAAVAAAQSQGLNETEDMKQQAEEQRRQLREKTADKITPAIAKVMDYLKG